MTFINTYIIKCLYNIARFDEYDITVNSASNKKVSEQSKGG